MKNLENWIVEVKPELVGLQNEVKSLLEIANASGKIVRNGYFGYPTIDLNEVGPFFQRVVFFKRREVTVKEDKVFKYLFAIENMTGMESMGGNFHFELFGATLENTLKYAGIDVNNPKPVPFILIYQGKKKYNENEYHAFDAVTMVDDETNPEDILESQKKNKKATSKVADNSEF